MSCPFELGLNGMHRKSLRMNFRNWDVMVFRCRGEGWFDGGGSGGEEAGGIDDGEKDEVVVIVDLLVVVKLASD